MLLEIRKKKDAKEEKERNGLSMCDNSCHVMIEMIY
jgi:hypothetical protein